MLQDPGVQQLAEKFQVPAEIVVRTGPALSGLTILILSLFVGALAVRGIATALHPLVVAMSSVIAGAIVVGGIQWAGDGTFSFAKVCGILATVLAAAQLTAALLMIHRRLSPTTEPPTQPSEAIDAPPGPTT